MADKNIDVNELNTKQNELKDYEIEVADKKGFLSNFFSKLFRTNNNQKLLNTADLPKAQTTTRSISSMWGFGSFRTNFFKTLDNARKAISEKLSPSNNESTWKPHVIDSNVQTQTQAQTKTNEVQAEATHTGPIIPKIKSTTPKGIINNSKTAEDVRLETLDTSGVEENALDAKDTKENEELEKADKAATIVTTINTGVSQTIEEQTNATHDERE